MVHRIYDTLTYLYFPTSLDKYLYAIHYMYIVNSIPIGSLIFNLYIDIRHLTGREKKNQIWPLSQERTKW